MDSTVSVCIVTHNSAGDLAACLDAVGELESPPLEVIVVDCASSDESVAIARGYAPNLRSLVVDALPENLGFSGGMNRAIERSRGDWVLSLNADAVLRRDYVQTALSTLHPSAQRIGSIAGRLVRLDSETPRLDACGMHLTRSWRHLDRGSGEVDHGQYAEPAEVFGATGAASLFRRKALDDVAIEGQFFLEEFHTYREDAELAFRLQERGWRTVYLPKVSARHRRTNLPSRRRSMSPAVNYHSLKNRYLLRCYHRHPGDWPTTGLPTFGRDVAALLYAATLERSSLVAFSWLWRRRAETAQRRRAIQSRRTVDPEVIRQWFRESERPVASGTLR